MVSVQEGNGEIKMSDDKMKKAIHKKRSRSYQNQLRQAVYSGDFEGIIKSVMLLAIKANDIEDWKASPRTFMELCQVLLKFRQEFGEGSEEYDEMLRMIQGGKED
jgi:hypothetical protein